jgi:hypothetical protein
MTVMAAMAGPLKAQGTKALQNVVSPCDSGLLLKIDYRGFGMISAPEGDRVYLQVCENGALAYQTARGRVRVGALDASRMSRLKAELQSPDLSGLDTHYSAPMAIDASVSLSLVIQREARTQIIKVDNVVTAWPPAPVDRLLTLADTFRSDAEFTLITFRPR